MVPSKIRLPLMCLALVLVVLAAYANHFQNGFHFDDFHTVTENPFIRELRNAPRFFTDPTMFSTMADHATWRPVTSLSLAIDYRLGGALSPLYFQLSTFLWFLLQLVLMLVFFRRIMDQSDPQASNLWIAFAAVAFYGLHPANAETVNYVIQRGDVFSTLGPVASLLWFIAAPSQRKFGLYLIPALVSYFAKAPALIFPLILLAYIYLFETDDSGTHASRWLQTSRAILPSVLVTAAAAILTAWMTPQSYNAGAVSNSLYRLTQPWVALHYFKSFFLPTELSADTDWGYVSDPLGTDAVAGYVFIAGLLCMAWRTARNRSTRPIAFGILWFLLALLPTSLMPLAEVTNDHRMFFPFVGLALAVFWSLRMVLYRKTAGFTASKGIMSASIAALTIALLLAAMGTWRRNEVWRTDDSLWADVVQKSPRNGRGLMNYGLTVMAKGSYASALSYFRRAEAFTPNYWSLEVNLAIANGGLNQDAEAERHFLRAMQLAPTLAEPDFYYARWLSSKSRSAEATALLESALRINRLSFDSRHLLLDLYARQGNRPALERVARETLQLAPEDPSARQAIASRLTLVPALVQPQSSTENFSALKLTPEAYLDLSLKEYQVGNFEASIAAAKQALKLRPNYAEAYNNIAAAYNSMGRWDQGIQAGIEAVRLKPGYQLAKNNLSWAISQKSKAQASK